MTLGPINATTVAAFLFASMLLSACGAPTLDSQTPAPTPSNDIRERLVAALQQPGKVIRMRVSFDDEGYENGIRSWIDLPNSRARYEQLQNGEPDVVHVITDDIEASYIRDMNRFSEHTFSLPPEITGALPASLHNPALRALWPLALAMWQDEWRPGGAGEWNGQTAILWEADFPGPELPMHTYTTIYLSPETDLPLGQIFRHSQREGEPAEFESTATYEIAFVPLDEAPPDSFNREALRLLPEGFGGLLDSAKAVEFPVLWFGRTAIAGGAYPKTPLARINIRREGEADGPYVAFHYRDTSSPSLHQGEVSIITRPTQAWQQNVRDHRDIPWWTGLERQPVVIDGLEGKYVVGWRARSSQVSPPAAEVIVWLPRVVVRIGALPTTNREGEDVNFFNAEPAMIAVLEGLRILD